MRFRYEGKDILLDANPWGGDAIRIRFSDGSHYLFSLGDWKNRDTILPGPVSVGQDSQGNEFYYYHKGNHCYIHYKGFTTILKREDRKLSSSGQSSGRIQSPMPGKIIKVLCEENQKVEAGDTLLILEAMKMEHQIQAPFSAKVQAIHCKLGDTVGQDQLLLELIQD